MTQDRPIEAARDILGRLQPGAEFRRVPASTGGGDVLIASVEEGCVAIAPPATALSLHDAPESLADWRVGWFEATEDGVDLDIAPDNQATVPLRELLRLDALSDAMPFVLARQVASVRHYALVRARLGGAAVARAQAKLGEMKAEWHSLFGAEPWPLDAKPPTRSATLAEALAVSGQRLVAMLFPLEAGFAGLHGAGSPSERSETTSRAMTFGSGLMLVRDAEGSRLEIRVDFDDVLRAHPDIGADPIAVYVVGPSDEVLGVIDIEPQTKQRSAHIDVEHSLEFRNLRLSVAVARTK